MKWTGTGSGKVTVVASNICGTSSGRSITTNISNCRVSDDASSTTAVIAYPNPVKDLLNVNFTSDVQQSYAVRIVDMTGRVVYNESRTSSEGENHVELNVSGFASGIYMLNFQMGDSNEQIRVVIE